jgi:hypothetical protein
MPDISLPPINQCSMNDAIEPPDATGTHVLPSPLLVTPEPHAEDGENAAGGKAGSEELVRRFSGEGAGPAAPEPTPVSSFQEGCGPELLRAVGSCGALLLTPATGGVALLMGANCAASLWAFDDCIDAPPLPR